MAERVGELSIEELRLLVREAVREALLDLVGDPDKAQELDPEFEERLRASLAAAQAGEMRSLDEVLERLEDDR